MRWSASNSELEEPKLNTSNLLNWALGPNLIIRFPVTFELNKIVCSD